jgi:hypothetical protein
MLGCVHLQAAAAGSCTCCFCVRRLLLLLLLLLAVWQGRLNLPRPPDPTPAEGAVCCDRCCGRCCACLDVNPLQLLLMTVYCANGALQWVRHRQTSSAHLLLLLQLILVSCPTAVQRWVHHLTKVHHRCH